MSARSLFFASKLKDNFLSIFSLFLSLCVFFFLSLCTWRTWTMEIFQMHREFIFHESLLRCYPFQYLTNAYHIYSKRINNFASDCFHWFSLLLLPFYFHYYYFCVCFFYYWCIHSRPCVGKQQTTLKITNMKPIRIFNGFKSAELFIHTLMFIRRSNAAFNHITADRFDSNGIIIMEHDHS